MRSRIGENIHTIWVLAVRPKPRFKPLILVWRKTFESILLAISVVFIQKTYHITQWFEWDGVTYQTYQRRFGAEGTCKEQS